MRGPRPDPGDRLGLAFAFASSLGLGLAMVISRYAYEGGANGLALGTARALLFVPALLAFCRLSGRRIRIDFRDWLHIAFLGLFMSAGFYGHVGAIEFISVGLAAILFYTFPPLIALFQWAVTRRPPGWVKTCALGVAFAGLTLMLGGSLEVVDPRGIGLALGAAVCIAWNTFWTAQRVPHVDGVVAVLHMGIVAMLVLSTVCLVTGAARLPQTSSGWVGLAAVASFQTLALPLWYLALPRIGSLKTAMVGNVQPVFSIAVAFLLFGELMSPVQLLGGAMVLLGIWQMQRQDRKEARTAL